MPSWGLNWIASCTPLLARSQGRSTSDHDDGLALRLMTRCCSRASIGRALRWWPGRQGLDAHHTPALARRAVHQRHAGQAQVAVAVVLALIELVRWRRRNAEQLAAAFELGIARSIGQQPVVADALQARRQRVQQEAPREFGGIVSTFFIAASSVGPAVRQINAAASRNRCAVRTKALRSRASANADGV